MPAWRTSRLDPVIAQAVGALPETQRTAMLLCRQDELSYEDIAKVLADNVDKIHRAATGN